MRTRLLSALFLPLFLLPRPLSQEEDVRTEVEGMLVPGSPDGSALTESLQQVDLIDEDDLTAQGRDDLVAQLSVTVPSFVSLEPMSVSDESAAVPVFTLRRMPPDSILFTVNGKKRHRSAAIYLYSAGIFSGSQGTDIASIPSIALRQVEILREGDAARHSSQAVAGGIDYTLKDAARGGRVETRWSRYFRGDGAAWTLSGNTGLPINPGRDISGFANLSFQYTTSEPTERHVTPYFADGLEAFGITLPGPPIGWGRPETNHDYRLAANTGLDLSDHAHLYLFGNHSRRRITTSGFYRSPVGVGSSGRGLFTTPDQGALVADIRRNPDPATVPSFPGTDIDGDSIADLFIPLPLRLALANPSHPVHQADPDNPSAPAFHTFHARYPDGFIPSLASMLEDFGVTGGVRGELENQWYYDLGAVVGRNRLDRSANNTVNPQLLVHPDFLGNPEALPDSYRTGGYEELDTIISLELGRPWETDWFASPLMARAGLDWRRDRFSVLAGEEYSWWTHPDMLAQGMGIGSQGHSGIEEQFAGTHSQESLGAWLDLETDMVERLATGATVRLESHEDYGTSLNGNVALHWQWRDSVAFRTSAGTSIRVPTAAQTGYRNFTRTYFGDPPDVVTQLFLPPSDPLARALGASPLETETAVNLNLGTVIDRKRLRLTLDGYQFRLRDRIILSDPLFVPPQLQQQAGAQLARYFLNAATVMVRGVDITVSYPLEHALGLTTLSLNLDLSRSEVVSLNQPSGGISNFTRVMIEYLERGTPLLQTVLTATHRLDRWTIVNRLRFHDGYREYHFFNQDWLYQGDPLLMVDLDITYRFDNGLFLTAGAQNLFDSHPTRTLAEHSYFTGTPYTYSSPFGFNGGFYYLRTGFSW